MATPTFGLIAEGVTDYSVLLRILAGHFNDRGINLRPFQPLVDVPQHAPESYGGWKNVFNYLESPKFEEAFQTVDFVIVQIDTDVCEEFGVSKQEAGTTLDALSLIDRVADCLKAHVAADVLERIGHRVIFAIAVDSTECWLLILHASSSRTAREQNCLKHLNDALRKKNRKTIAPENKEPRIYQELAREFSDPKVLKRCVENCGSLKRFVDGVESAVVAIPASEEPCP